MLKQLIEPREARPVDAFVSLADSPADSPADSLVGDDEVVELVHTLIDHCVDLLGVTAAGPVLRDRGGDLEVQVGIDDIAAGVPWPAFEAAAAHQGLRSVHAVPMRLRDRTIGALNLLGARPGALDEADAKVARALAAGVTGAAGDRWDAVLSADAARTRRRHPGGPGLSTRFPLR